MSIEAPKVSAEAIVAVKWYRKMMFFYTMFILLINYGVYWVVAVIERDRGDGHFYSYLYLYYPFVTALIVAIVGLYYFKSMQFFTLKYSRVVMILVVFVFSNLLLFLSAAPLMSKNIPYYIIHILFIVTFTLLLIYYIRYRKIWSHIMQGVQGIKYAKQMESHGWTHNFANTQIFNDKDAKNTLDTKLVNKLAWFFIRYGWLGGLLIYMGSAGLGGDSLLLFVSVITILLAPECGRLIANIHEVYLYFSRIEKENNVTIYNDIWND